MTTLRIFQGRNPRRSRQLHEDPEQWPVGYRRRWRWRCLWRRRRRRWSAWCRRQLPACRQSWSAGLESLVLLSIQSFWLAHCKSLLVESGKCLCLRCIVFASLIPQSLHDSLGDFFVFVWPGFSIQRNYHRPMTPQKGFTNKVSTCGS